MNPVNKMKMTKHISQACVLWVLRISRRTTCLGTQQQRLSDKWFLFLFHCGWKRSVPEKWKKMKYNTTHFTLFYLFYVLMYMIHVHVCIYSVCMYIYIYMCVCVCVCICECPYGGQVWCAMDVRNQPHSTISNVAAMPNNIRSFTYLPGKDLMSIHLHVLSKLV